MDANTGKRLILLGFGASFLLNIIEFGMFIFKLNALPSSLSSILYGIASLATIAGFVISYLFERNLLDALVAGCWVINLVLNLVLPTLFNISISIIGFWFSLVPILIWAYKCWIQNSMMGYLVAGSVVISIISRFVSARIIVDGLYINMTNVYIVYILSLIACGLKAYVAYLDSE